MNEPPAIVRFADDAQEAMRELAHLTLRGAVPAPVLYAVLGRLQQVGPALDQTLRQLGDALLDSLTVYDVVQDDGGDPLLAAARCCYRLSDAAAHAAHLGAALADAQTEIGHQGYRTSRSGVRRPDPRPPRDTPGPGCAGPSR